MHAWMLAAAIAALVVRVGPPALPATTSGGEVMFKLGLSAVGQVRTVEVLRDVPPFTEAVDASLRDWRFGPTAPGEGPAERQVLVTGIFRPPALYDLSPPAPLVPMGAVPATVPLPVRWERPLYPPRAIGDGVVILELNVAVDGRVEEVSVLYSVPPFDAPAKDAARRWWFRPAVWEGKAIRSVTYVVFGFRQPTN